MAGGGRRSSERSARAQGSDTIASMFELGNNLREARQRRRIDLVAAEQDTKIRSKYLAALEDEEFELLPGPVFIRGFLRTYARYLGLEPQLFIDEYNARFGRFEDVDDASGMNPVLGRPGLAYEHQVRGRRLMRAAVITTLVVMSVLIWLALRDDVAKQDAARVPTHVARPVSEQPPIADAEPVDRAALATAARVARDGHVETTPARAKRGAASPTARP